MPTDTTNPWYLAVPVGKKLMVPDMCSDAGLIGKKTNHSLCVSGATSLFEVGVPERVIQQLSGHRSLLSLQMYERVSDGQEKAMLRILTGEKSNYNKSVMESTTSSFTSSLHQKLVPMNYPLYYNPQYHHQFLLGFNA